MKKPKLKQHTQKKASRYLSLFKADRSLVIIFSLGVLAFLFLLLLNDRIPGSDDTVFQTQILPYPDVFSWIVDRYYTWSGRIFSEAFVYLFSPAPFYLWQIATLGIFALFVGMLFAYSQLLGKKQTNNQRNLLLVLAFSLPFIMNHHVLAEGGLWMTGSMVYFWTSTLGLVAFYPVAYYILKQKKPHWLISSVGILSALVAASSQEQVGAVLLGLTIAFLIYHIKTSGKIPRYIIVFGLVIGTSLLISLLAPGNTARLEAETATWLPDFQTTPILERVQYGYRWLLEAFINHGGFLLITSWVSMAALFAYRSNKTILDNFFIFTFLLASVLTLASSSELLSPLFTFYASWKPSISQPLVSLNLLPWSLVLLCTVIAPLFLFPKKNYGYFISLIFTASLAAAIVLLLSPTMYASLWRSFFVPSVLLIIAAYLLMDRALNTYPRYRYIIIGIITSIASLHYIFQAARLVQ